MRKQQNDEPEAITTLLHMWSYEEATKATPYLRTLMQSLREHWLEMQQAQLQLNRLDARPSRPTNRHLLRRDEWQRLETKATEEFESTLHELLEIDVFCINPVCGLALMPFRHAGDLAWFVFDLFSADGLDGWRLHADSLEVRRPLIFLRLS